MKELFTTYNDIYLFVQQNLWLTILFFAGAISFILYRLADILQARHAKKHSKPDDLKLSEEIYKKKQGGKHSRSWQLFFKGSVSWFTQIGYVASMPFLVGLLHQKGVSYGIIYIILMVASFLLNVLLSKLFPLWSPVRPTACRAYQHEKIWQPGNLMFHAWGVTSWAIPVYFLWDFFKVNGWIGSVIFIIIAQLIQLLFFIYTIKKTATPYQQYSGLSTEFKENLHKYLQEQGIKDEEVGVLSGMKMGPNAFATSIGSYRQIVFTEELIKGYKDPSNPDFTLKLSEDTIEAITSHEVGHIKHRHVEKSIALGIIVSSAVTIIVYHLFSGAPESYSFAQGTSQQLLLYWGQSIFNILLLYPLTFFMLGMGRSNETQADTFLLETNGCKNGQDFFHQIRHIAPVTNHSWWHSCNGTHPQPHIREERMKKWSEEHCK